MLSLLLTFALPEESRPFQKLVGPRPDLRILLTGIGKRSAEKAVRDALAELSPKLVLTCGFAGGLNPELTTGTVVFSADEDFSLSPALREAGARPVNFHRAERVVAAATDKGALWRSTGADAVEMESGVIRSICRELEIPGATVRVISDAAHKDLPLDFNQLMREEQTLSYGKLALALLKSPGRVRALLQLRQQTQAAAERLAQVLAKAIANSEYGT